MYSEILQQYGVEQICSKSSMFFDLFPIGVVTKIGANRNWQCQLPTQIGSNQTANLKVAVVIFHNFLRAIIQA